MIRLKKSLGTILTSLRREAGLTQPRVSELLAAEGIDIKPAGISKWEKDMTMPNAAQFLALCAIYGVTDVMATFTGAGGSLAGLNAEANGNFDLGKVYMVLGIAIIPLIIVYLCLSKFIIRGVALGSVKG